MPYFLCRLATEEGWVISQSFFSLSRNECKKHFETKGFCILSIKRDWKRIDILDVPFEKKIKSKDFIMFNQELVSLIKAGYPILKCIEIITSRIKNTRLKELLMAIGNTGEMGGTTISGALISTIGFSRVFLYSGWIYGPALIVLYFIKSKYKNEET